MRSFTCCVLFVALVAAVGTAAPLAVGESLPGGDVWRVHAQSDTLVVGNGWLLFDQTGSGIPVVDGVSREAATVWLYNAPGGVVRRRIGPIQLRGDDGPRSLLPPSLMIHAIQYATEDTLVLAVRQ